jgi:hypothetical protein
MLKLLHPGFSKLKNHNEATIAISQSLYMFSFVGAGFRHEKETG